MNYRLESATEQLIMRAVEDRLAKLDELIDATHSMMDASQAATDAMARTIFVLQERIELLEEWARLRLDELQHGSSR